jgi:hypothetical protein
VLAGPIGAAGAPAFRVITAVDVPALDVSKLTTGTLPVARGGTGLSAAGANGQVLTTVAGVPVWTNLPASSGEGAVYNGNKTITGTLSVATTTITGSLNLNTGGLFINGATILDASQNAYVQRLTVSAGATINSSLNTRDITPITDNLYPLGSSTKRFGGLYSTAANIGSLTIASGAGVGKVLTSDASGNATWQAPAAPSNNFTDIFVSNQTRTGSLTVTGVANLVGNAAIGVLGGNSRLDVNGTIGTKGQILGIDSVTGIMKWQTAGSSDRRLKEDITELSGVLGKLDALHGVNFAWKADKDKKKQLGVIAQDVEKAFPELVETDSATGMKSVNYPGLAAVALQGVKELDAKLKGPLAVNGDITVAGNIVPSEDNKYSLGSPSKHFSDIYVGPHTIYYQNPETKENIAVDWKAAQAIVDVAKNGMGGGLGGGSAKDPMEKIFAKDVNLENLTVKMANPESATASVNKIFGAISADGTAVKLGFINGDPRTDNLVADMTQAKADIALLKAQLATVLEKMEADANSCKQVQTILEIKKTIPSGDWTLIKK